METTHLSTVRAAHKKQELEGEICTNYLILHKMKKKAEKSRILQRWN